MIDISLTNNSKNSTLYVHVSKDTKSVELFDFFEGLNNNKKHSRIVVTSPYLLSKNGNLIDIYYVIERGNAALSVGDITFTKFKKDKYSGPLFRYANKEITENIINEYYGTGKIYRFSKPFHLRAQNSNNRRNYGTKHYWHGSTEYIEQGTLYGETTDYLIVGAFIGKSFNEE